MDFNKKILETFPINIQKKLITLSLSLLDEKIPELNDAIKEKNKTKIHFILHSLKGLNSIGIDKLSVHCNNMMKELNNPSHDLDENFQLLKKYIRAYKILIQDYYDNIHMFNSE